MISPIPAQPMLSTLTINTDTSDNFQHLCVRIDDRCSDSPFQAGTHNVNDIDIQYNQPIFPPRLSSLVQYCVPYNTHDRCLDNFPLFSQTSN